MTTPLSRPSPSVHGSPRDRPLYDLYRRFRRILLRSDRSGSSLQVAEYVLDSLVEDAGEHSVVVGGRVYRIDGDAMVLEAKRGAAGPAPVGLRVPRGYSIVKELQKRGFVVVMTSDPRIDSAIEEQIGLEPYAAIAFGARRTTVVAFGLRPGVEPADLEVAFEILQSVADTCWQGRSMSELLSQSAQIQTSLLPQHPEIPGFELACRSRPADVVGGDFYDVTELATGTFAVSVGDATGHGLPAALQARDAVIGLRMGLEQQLKSVALFRRLDAVLSRSHSPSRFVSLCYIELDPRGHFIYVNAGHVPPLIVGVPEGERRTLDSTGAVLGLPATAPREYRRAFDRLGRHETLIAYTDGIVEAEGHDGAEIGIELVVEAVRENTDSLERAVDVVFERLDELSHDPEPVDDQTLLLLRRQA